MNNNFIIKFGNSFSLIKKKNKKKQKFKYKKKNASIKLVRH